MFVYNCQFHLRGMACIHEEEAGIQSPEIPSNLNFPLILTLQVFSQMPICTGYWDHWRQSGIQYLHTPIEKFSC